MKTNHNSNAQYFQKALAGVESESIKAWATSNRNRPIMQEISKSFQVEGKEVTLMTIFIVSSAMG